MDEAQRELLYMFLTEFSLPKPNEVSTIIMPILPMRKMKPRVYTADGRRAQKQTRAAWLLVHALVHYTQLLPTSKQDCWWRWELSGDISALGL